MAARGLDILGVENVINYDAPRTLVRTHAAAAAVRVSLFWFSSCYTCSKGGMQPMQACTLIRLVNFSICASPESCRSLYCPETSLCRMSQEDYLHRIGRTARAGAAGRALTFVEDCDRGLLKQVLLPSATEDHCIALRFRAPNALSRFCCSFLQH